MKIIQANKFYFRRGGAETYMLDLSLWLSRQGHDVIPFAMEHPNNLPTPYAQYFPSYVPTAGVSLSPKMIHTLGRMVYSFESRRKLATLIYRTAPDLLHAHNIYTQLSPSLFHTTSDQRVPVVMTVHDHHLVRSHYLRYAETCNVKQGIRERLKCALQAGVFRFHQRIGWYSRFVSQFIVPSVYLKRQLIEAGINQSTIAHVPFGVDLSRFVPHEEPRRDYVLFVGRLSYEKGVETVIELAKRLPDVRVRIVGTGPDEARLHRMAHQYKNIEFLGFKTGDELIRLYQHAIVTVVPSRVHETFGLVAMESMACATPVVASQLGGLSEVVDDHRNGFLVEPLHIAGWSEAVLRLVYDEELQRSFAQDARAKAEKAFCANQHWPEVMRVYQSVLG